MIVNLPSFDTREPRDNSVVYARSRSEEIAATRRELARLLAKRRRLEVRLRCAEWSLATRPNNDAVVMAAFSTVLRCKIRLLTDEVRFSVRRVGKWYAGRIQDARLMADRRRAGGVVHSGGLDWSPARHRIVGGRLAFIENFTRAEMPSPLGRLWELASVKLPRWR